MWQNEIFQEFAFDRNVLKHSTNFESAKNVRSSNIVEFEFELRHIPKQDRAEAANGLQNTATISRYRRGISHDIVVQKIRTIRALVWYCWLVVGGLVGQMRLSDDEPSKPSRVLHLRGLPPDTTEAEITQLITLFGIATNIILTRQKRQVSTFIPLLCKCLISANLCDILWQLGTAFNSTVSACPIDRCWTWLRASVYYWGRTFCTFAVW